MDEQIIRGLQNSPFIDSVSGGSENIIPALGTPLTSEEAMALAIFLAGRRPYKVSPNPAVGCVVMDAQGKYLGSGYHEYCGGPHAEVNALKGLTRDQLKGAHVFVTLEPCAHEGRTPSCAKMLVTYPIAKVVYGVKDPNPLVAGKGAAILENHGIVAELYPAKGNLTRELQEICEAFLWNQNFKKPFVALKIASSLDSQLSLESGESKWVTGDEARRYVHHLRACYDGLLVSAKTILTDNPSLNIRNIPTDKTNVILIADRQGELLDKVQQLEIFKVHLVSKIILFVDETLKNQISSKKQDLISIDSNLSNLRIEFIPTRGIHLDFRALLDRCWDLKVYSIFIEAGARMSSGLIADQLIQRLYLFQSLSLFGADQHQSWTQGLKLQSLRERYFLQNPRFQGFSEQDFLISGLLTSK